MTALLIAALLLFQGLEDMVTDPAPANEAATAFIAAFRDGDAGAMDEVAAARRADPFLVADALLERRALDAARAFAERVGDTPLSVLVEEWGSWGEEDHAADTRLRELIGSEPEEMIAALEGAPPGVAAIRLRAAVVEGLSRIDWKAAAEAYLRAAQCAEEIGWEAERCRNELRAAVLLYHAGIRDEGLRILDIGLSRYVSLARPAQSARLLRYAAEIYYQAARLEDALEASELALQEYLAAGDWDGAVRARILLSTACIERGLYGRALEALQLALVDSEAHGAELHVATVRGEMGNVYDNIGRYREALKHHRFAHEEKQRLGEQRGAAISLLNVGLVLVELGRYMEALDAYEEARSESLAVGNKRAAATLLNNIANVYISLRLPERALEYGLRSIAEKEELGLTRSLSYSYGVVTAAYGSLGDYEKKLEYATLTYEAWKAMGHPASAYALGQIASAYRSLGEPDKALEYYERGREEALAAGIAFGTQFSLLLKNTAHAHSDLGDDTRALEHCDAAIAVAEECGNLSVAAVVQNTRISLLLKLGRPEEALRGARRALEQRLESSRDLGQRLGGEVRVHAAESAMLGVTAIVELREVPDEGDRLAEAFWLAESGRGLLLAESLVNREALRTGHLSPEILEAEAAARSELAAARAKLREAGMRGASEESLLAARDELDAAYAELEGVLERAERENRRAMEAVAPRAIELPELQDLLRAESAFVHYQRALTQLYALVVTRDAVELILLGERQQLLERAERYSTLVARPGTDEEELAGELYDSLLAPLEPALGERTRLLISPFGPLSFLPFEALLRREGEETIRLLECWEVAYVPSGTVYAALLEDAAAQEPGEGLVALGNPVYPGAGELLAADTRALELRGLGELSPLPQTAVEVRAIASFFPDGASRLLLREEASLAGLTAALDQIDGRLAALHLACHGILDTQRPLLTGLVLSNAEVLAVHDIYNLSVPADLVVLSACETGRGPLQRGEGVLGLARAFFFAGSPRVVVSNWKVDDASTRTLMVDLYGDIAAGAGPGAALRSAKLARLRGGGELAHPYHWAGFVLWGLAD